MPTLSPAAPRPGSGLGYPSDRCSWYLLLGSCQGFAMSDTWVHLLLPWVLQLEPCHRLAQSRGWEGGSLWVAGGVEATSATQKVWWVWA